LDVDLSVWHERVHKLSPNLCDFVRHTLDELNKIEPVILL
jgi:hypothetical protein